MFKRITKKIQYSFSHTVELNQEYYLTKYQNEYKKLYNQEYPQIKGFATQEGCKEYQNNAEIPHSNFRINYKNNLELSSIGIGTYQGAPDENNDIMQFGSIIDSLQSGGVNVIDTAINYRYMKSERVIGAALRYLNIPREQVFLSTKNGYIPADGDKGIQENAVIDALKGKIPDDEIVGACNCMHPLFLEQQLNQSLKHLGVETVDLLYLHNVAEAQLPVLGYDKFYNRLAKAFEYLENMVQQNKIKQYGLATWVCFRARKDEDRLHLPLEKVCEIAEKVGGSNHHFNYIQMPINLMMPEAFAEEWQPYKGEYSQILTVAKNLKINISVSSPLMGGALIQVPLPSELFKCQYLGAKHLQFLRSIPADAIKTILIGQKANRHTKTNLEVLRYDPLSVEEFWSFFQPKKRKESGEDEMDMS